MHALAAIFISIILFVLALNPGVVHTRARRGSHTERKYSTQIEDTLVNTPV
ncbi:MAG: hypothetical protein J07HQW2_02985 [Haloquadratum walsbyi J07HQW2]|uniref:Uncharacterized protein n=1 Tax=Haloquadratum walsbyi J07HQW2 TaxID=1238425 RepID=U1NH75_9EURY|nr:MAG: hypothetical protein J07HQW2_02985 [Haloquadratum walsbyi J07HQW2]